MPSRRWLSLLLLAACGDGLTADLTAASTTGTTGEPTTGDVLSAGQTSAPTDGTITGDPADPTSTTDSSSSAASTTGSPLDCPAELVLADPQLHTLVRVRLDLPQGPIPGELAPALEVLDTDHTDVSSLAGLECFPNLKTLRLGAGTIADLAPLSHSKKLESLALPGHQLVDLSPLAGLPELRRLAIRANPVTDLSALGLIPKLDTLDVTFCPLPSFDQLAGLPLVELWADHVSLPLGPIGTLKQLKIFHMEFAEVTDIGPLAGATALVTLAMRSNAIADLTPLAGASNLQDLDLADNSIVDVAPLADLPALRRLAVGANMIFDPAPLGSLPALEILELSWNPLGPDLGALVALDGLVELDLRETGRDVLLPFAPQTLTVLRAGKNAIADLGPLAGHTKLRSLSVPENAIVTIAPIAAAPFWNNGCMHLNILGNPLDADTLENHIPPLCQLETRIAWDQGECDACPFQ
jgi:hypothetical protein